MKNRITGAIFGWLVIGLMYILPIAQAAAQETVPQPSSAIREDFSDDELKSFVNANEKVMAIQMEAEQNMIKAIEDEGLTVDRFHQILEDQRDPQRGTEETSPEELKSFNNAAKVILEENAKVEEQMTTSIEEEGINIETYKQIMMAYQQSPAVQSRVNGMVRDEN